MNRMTAGEACRREVICATEDMSIKQAAERMRDQHVGSLVVIRKGDSGEITTGILTDRDIAIVAVARDFDPQTLRVGDVMSSDLVSARPEDSLADALATMRGRGVRRLPITTEQGTLIGMLTLDDLLELLADELKTMVLTMEGGVQHETRVRV